MTEQNAKWIVCGKLPESTPNVLYAKAQCKVYDFKWESLSGYSKGYGSIESSSEANALKIIFNIFPQAARVYPNGRWGVDVEDTTEL